MTDHEMTELAETILGELARLKPEEIQPWMRGYVNTHPKEVVQAVNLLVKDDERFKDANRRMVGWLANHPKILVSWSHVSPATAASLRLAASWRSLPFKDRVGPAGEYPVWALRKTATEQVAQARIESERWGGCAVLNKAGVGLQAPVGLVPEFGEVPELVSRVKADTPPGGGTDWGKYYPIGITCVVLCTDGRIIEGLPTWSHG